MKIFLLVLCLLAPGLAWSAEVGSKIDVAPVAPARGHGRITFAVDRAGWPAAARVLIEVYLSHDGGQTWDAKPFCTATTRGGVVLDAAGKEIAQTSIDCPLLGDRQSLNRRAKVTVTVSGATVGALTTETKTK